MSASSGSNTLTGLIPVIYEAMDVIPRELIGAIGGVTMDPSADMAGLNQTIRSHVVPAASMVDVAPGVTNTNGSGATIGYADLQITKVKNSPILWSGEEQLLLKDQYSTIVRDQFAQAFRTLSNAIEADVVNAAAAGASRATGTAGTVPFGSSVGMDEFGAAYQVLDDNGAPVSDRSMILGTRAARAVKAIPNLFKANEAGSTDLLRNGNISSSLVEGFALRTSGQIKGGASVGSGTSYVLNGAHAVGATTINVHSGTGTILAGDVVTIDSVNYIAASALSGGSFTIASPGLTSSGADGDAVTVNAKSVKNVFLQKAGFLLATRLPAMPLGGDSASDMTVVTDPVSGLSFQIALYRQYRQITIDVGIAWGTKVLRSDYVGVLMG